MVQRALSLLVLGSGQSQLDSTVSVIRQKVRRTGGTSVEGGPMQSIPSLLVNGSRVATEGLALGQALLGIGNPDCGQDHARRPGIVLRVEIDRLLRQGREERLHVGVGAQIPGIEKDVLKAALVLLGSGGRLLLALLLAAVGGQSLVDHRVALIVHNFVVLGEVVAVLLAENLAIGNAVAKAAAHEDGLGQSILHQVERSHDGLDGQTDDHSLVVVQTDRHADAEQSGAKERGGLRCNVSTELLLRVLLLGVGGLKGHRRRGDVDEPILVLAGRNGPTGNVDVRHEEDDDGLDRAVGAPEQIDRVGILPVDLPRRQHDGEHHEHLVERHGLRSIIYYLRCEEKQCDVLEPIGRRDFFWSCSKVTTRGPNIKSIELEQNATIKLQTK
mmetsp:Transcript_12230/g.34986  ORF Transcript_12230/g.34986 Transcript_12230/m.34986 type:complete len:386 (+) Transcript_12230:2090-3247(+)